ncbi:ataxin-10 isoform X5 [Anas platyrhynchos]|uniref:Ataxin-10 n=1 Tax=Anas platyrhynchos platyrhynchos TaxID=8840 RepID=U3ISD6_ANAPP|eukprot:XP_027308353.1 ataxin-10 isoform X5 [Anas platyrhynchos]
MAAAGSGSRSLLAAAARLGCSMAAAPAARLESVRALTGLLREAQHREMAQESIFQDLLKILTKALNEIEQASKDSCELLDLDTCLLLVAECFRCLRNACVECAKNQDVMRNLGLITTSVHLIKLLDGIEIKGEPLLTAFHCSLQFLGNIAAGNGDSQNSIWKCAFPDLFLFLIVTDRLLKCPELVKVLYAKLSNQERVTLLELIMSKVSEKNSVTSEETNVFMRIADFLASCFRDKCETVLKLTSAGDAEDEEALVTVRLLDVLCEMTSNNGQLEHLQALPGLLETAIDTLRLTHLAGKQAVNIFTATHAMTGQEEISHPAVGFKSHLIRLIGNLCYKSKENQDKVYELDGIPLILDNCSIDDNNPFVNQWAVYAIRNLTEQNERNQELIARMEEKGLADNSVLERMGLEVEKQDDKLLLRSVRKKPS